MIEKPIVAAPEVKSDVSDVFMSRLWRFHRVYVGEEQRYLCPECELCCAVGTEFQCKSKTPVYGTMGYNMYPTVFALFTVGQNKFLVGETPPGNKKNVSESDSEKYVKIILR